MKGIFKWPLRQVHNLQGRRFLRIPLSLRKMLSTEDLLKESLLEGTTKQYLHGDLFSHAITTQ